MAARRRVGCILRVIRVTVRTGGVRVLADAARGSMPALHGAGLTPQPGGHHMASAAERGQPLGAVRRELAGEADCFLQLAGLLAEGDRRAGRAAADGGGGT